MSRLSAIDPIDALDVTAMAYDLGKTIAQTKRDLRAAVAAGFIRIDVAADGEARIVLTLPHG
jgi:hypothetical protein